MANDQEENAKPAPADGAVDRRVVLAGAAAAALTGAMPHRGLSQRLSPDGSIHIDAGVYMDATYLDTFNNKKYSNPQAIHQQIHEVLYQNNRIGLRWGFYQQQLETDKSKWGGAYNYDNWPTFRDEMREDLERQLPYLKNSKNAMNPFDTSLVAPNFRDHLDEAIRIALWDRADVQVKIEVKKAKRRHHGLITEWHPDPNSGHNPDSFTIKVECPDGGWQGYALWRNPNPTSTPITNLVSTWKVPAAPTNANGTQIVFLFNGLESVPAANVAGGILQAVLQWTNAGWFIRSWYVTSDFDPVLHPQLPPSNQSVDQAHMTDGRCYSTAISVQAGATVTGTIMGDKDAHGKFNYSCSIAANGQHADLSINDVPEMIYAVCAIESYDVNDPTKDYPDYPHPITMSGIDLQVQHSSVNPIPWATNKKQGKDYEAVSMNPGTQIDFRPT